MSKIGSGYQFHYIPVNTVTVNQHELVDISSVAANSSMCGACVLRLHTTYLIPSLQYTVYGQQEIPTDAPAKTGNLLYCTTHAQDTNA